MGRWLAYSGSPIALGDVLFTAVHSFIDQSLHSKLGAETTNGDGFGIGWYDGQEAPSVFRSIEPAWNDANLREMTRHVTSTLFFAHIRAAIGFSRPADELSPDPPWELVVDAPRLRRGARGRLRHGRQGPRRSAAVDPQGPRLTDCGG